MKFLIFIFASAFLSSCQSLFKRNETHPPVAVSPKAPSPVASSPGRPSPPSPLETQDYILVENEQDDAPPANPSSLDTKDETSLPPRTQVPKIALILGPGGAKTFAHIGVLQEFQKEKIPIHSAAGFEFAAPMAALFSWKGFVNDVDWQMSKLKENDVLKKNLISSDIKTTEITVMNEFLKNVFHNLKAEDLKKPFACPSLNLEKNQTYMMAKGPLDQLLLYCLPYPPLFKPYNKSISAVQELKLTSDYLRSKGANYVVFINVLGGSASKKSIGSTDEAGGILWAEMMSAYSKPQLGIDSMVLINLDGYHLSNFDKRVEIIQKGSEQARSQLRVLSNRLGL